jgi:exodeoxyribonuclease V
MKFSPQQAEAALMVKAWLKDPSAPQVFYLAGFAGTGKTTIANRLAEDVRNVLFAAFTGKAALVLAQKGCRPSSTIHSLIYKVDENQRTGLTRFVLNKDSELMNADLLIVDEVSMVGEDLAFDLLSFGIRVLVLGDPAQLPPVGGEGFFTKREPDYMLTEVHRQAADNPIIRMSMDIRAGKTLQVSSFGESRVIPREALTSDMVLDADQVIVGMNKTRRAYNARIRDLLGMSGRFSLDDRVVTLRNDQDRGLLNGALWRVRKVEFSGAETSDLIIEPDDAMAVNHAKITTHHAWLNGTEKELPWREQKEYQPVDYGYALSCHKAQGSQWGDVLVFDESRAFREDAAKWLYTAVTRAADRVIIVR